MTAPSPLRKRPLEADAATSVRDNDEINIAGCATIAYSSENPAGRAIAGDGPIGRNRRQSPFPAEPGGRNRVALEQDYDVVAAGASATAASVVSRRKVKLSCR